MMDFWISFLALFPFMGMVVPATTILLTCPSVLSATWLNIFGSNLMNDGIVLTWPFLSCLFCLAVNYVMTFFQFSQHSKKYMDWPNFKWPTWGESTCGGPRISIGKFHKDLSSFGRNIGWAGKLVLTPSIKGVIWGKAPIVEILGWLVVTPEAWFSSFIKIQVDLAMI